MTIKWTSSFTRLTENFEKEKLKKIKISANIRICRHMLEEKDSLNLDLPVCGIICSVGPIGSYQR